MLCRGRRPQHAQRDHVGTWEIPRSASGGKPPWSASGRRGAEADDARTWEVRLRHSSGEADEQGRATGCGAGGAKGGDRGECGSAQHAPAQYRESVSQALGHIRQIAKRALRRQTPEVGAVCGKSARTDLCGGRPVMDVPTAIPWERLSMQLRAAWRHVRTFHLLLIFSISRREMQNTPQDKKDRKTETEYWNANQKIEQSRNKYSAKSSMRNNNDQFA